MRRRKKKGTMFDNDTVKTVVAGAVAISILNQLKK